MTRLRRFASTRTGKMLLAVGIVVAVSAPAMAEHFDWEEWNAQEAGARDELDPVEDLHFTCPEGVTEDECKTAVNEVANELADSEHPENHGKYVSFVAHCLQGMKGKGSKMRTVAQADEDSQMETAVQVCSEWQLSPDNPANQELVSSDETESTEDSTEVGADHGKGKGKGKGHGKGKGLQK